MQRWHDCNGLPVHHFGGPRGSVFAYEEEIDQWLEGLAKETETVQVRADEHLISSKRSSCELTVAADGMWETRSERNIQIIADLYRKAIEMDSSNTSALVGLANAMVFCVLNDMMDGAMAYPSAIEALRRVRQLDPEHLDAKCPAAWLDLLFNRNWHQARAGFEESTRKRPSSFAFAGLAATNIAEGKMPEALECSWAAWRLSPLVCSLGGLLCWIAYLGGDFHRVLDMVAQIRSGGGDLGLVTTVEALVLVQDGCVTENLSRLEKATIEFPQNHTLQGALGYAYGVAGEKDKAGMIRAKLAHYSKTNMKSNGYALAILSLGLDDTEVAISWLETAFVEGTLWSLGIRSDPFLRSLRGNLRFEQLVGKIGVSSKYSAEAGFGQLATQPFRDEVPIGKNP